VNGEGLEEEGREVRGMLREEERCFVRKEAGVRRSKTSVVGWMRGGRAVEGSSQLSS
jgi:hypothetical protein